MFSANFKNKIRIDPEALEDPNPYDPEIEKQFKIIFDEILAHPELKNITLSGNWITAHELEKLGNILKNHQQLQFLNLDYNSVDLKAIPFLKKIINDHSLLTHINLCHNEIDDGAFQALLTDESLDYIQRIKNINFRLYGNQITEKGIDFSFENVSLDTLETAVAFNKVKEELEGDYFKKIEGQRNTLMETSSPSILYGASAIGKEYGDKHINTFESKRPQKPSSK